MRWFAAIKMATGENFLKWLNNKLRELKTDENVYGSYIIGILDGDEPIDEKKEALEEILSQIIVSCKPKSTMLTLRSVDGVCLLSFMVLSTWTHTNFRPIQLKLRFRKMTLTPFSKQLSRNGNNATRKSKNNRKWLRMWTLNWRS